ncbi:MAG TPA: type I secretion system permease/ATPase [Burkholderiales bacterium]|nr:type I secretion system permease/ATPase [Burkholderiales bacterium]
MRDYLAGCRPILFYAGLFSLAINLLLLVPPLYMLQVFDRVLASRSEETLAALTLMAVAALVVLSFLDTLRAKLLALGGLALDRKLGPRVIDGLLARATRLGGTVQGGLLRDVAALRTFFGGQGILALYDAPWLPVFLAVVLLFHPLLGAIALAGTVAMLLLAVLNERFARAPHERAQGAARRAAGFVDTAARNAEVVSALGMLPAVTRRWSGANDDVLRAQVDAAAVGGRFGAATRLARQLIQVGMLAAGAWLVIEQQVTAGVMIAATLLLSRALAPVEQLVAGWRHLVEARAAWRRLDELLRAEPGRAAATELPAPVGRLEVEAAGFAFPGAARPALRNVSFSLAPGESLAIIGASASGKSTLARLIAGVWRPSAGAVRLDGADVLAWPREQLGPCIGYLPQDVELFGGTVAENIARLGEPDSAEVVRAAQRAQVHDLILRLPKGYDTELAPYENAGALALSPGQRQRVALARALYGRPKLVVLDEPNSNLDHEGHLALSRALALLVDEGVTLVLIAHRPSLLARIGKVLVLREGSVESFGPTAQILRRVAPQAVPAREVA